MMTNALRVPTGDANAEIAAVLRMSDHEAGPAVGPTRERFESAFRNARSHPASPFRTFDHQHDAFVRRCVGQGPRGQLAVLIEGAKYFERMAADTSAWPTTRRAEDEQHAAMTAASVGAQLVSLGLTFNPLGFIASMRSRGIAIAPSGDGDLVIAPVSLMNATDRDLIRTNKAAIVSALKDSAVF
jgi:hypothetical protein